jgi:hypothetical protein
MDKELIRILEIAINDGVYKLDFKSDPNKTWILIQNLTKGDNPIFEMARMPYSVILTDFPEYKPAKELLYKLKRNQKIEDLGL